MTGVLAYAIDWSTLSSLGTALGTLVLAVATFASVRSGERSARISETALQEQRRPVFNVSRVTDSAQKMMFVDRHWVNVDGGQATAEHIDGVVYLTISLRNVGAGMGVCQGWAVSAPAREGRAAPDHVPLDRFRAHSRDLYIPGGDIGMWQGALRGPDDPEREDVADAVDAGVPIAVELLYTDLVGGQRTITRFGLFEADGSWYPSMSRHWHLDAAGPRPDQHVAAATEEVLDHVRQAGVEERDIVH